MGRLTTHVLDTMRGRPAAEVAIELTRAGETLSRTRTNVDGRTDVPLLDGDAFVTGTYELVFDGGAYFAGLDLPEPPFLGLVPVRFAVADARAHYHVPLLVSPYAYSTYRGS